jgi:hypothetical protein
MFIIKVYLNIVLNIVLILVTFVRNWFKGYRYCQSFDF